MECTTLRPDVDDQMRAVDDLEIADIGLSETVVDVADSVDGAALAAVF